MMGLIYMMMGLIYIYDGSHLYMMGLIPYFLDQKPWLLIFSLSGKQPRAVFIEGDVN